MEFGLFYQLPVGPGQSTAQRYADTLAQIVLGDDLGFDVAWLAEMHFIPPFSALPSPMLVAANLAARTRRIRLGIGVTLLPLHDPLRAAEDAATLDILCGGRLEYGIGRGTLVQHFDGYGVPIREREERFVEAMQVLLGAWRDEPLTFDGKYHRYHQVNVIPKPLQRPHPRLRLAANSDESAERGGREGWPIMVSPITASHADLERRITRYHGLRLERDGAAHPPGDVAMLIPVFLLPDGEKARAQARASIMHYFSVVSATALEGYLSHGGDPKELPAGVQRLRNLTYEDVLQTMGAIGSPSECVRVIAGLRQRYGTAHVICWFNPGGLIPPADVEATMRLFASEVMPALKT